MQNSIFIKKIEKLLPMKCHINWVLKENEFIFCKQRFALWARIP